MGLRGRQRRRGSSDGLSLDDFTVAALRRIWRCWTRSEPPRSAASYADDGWLFVPPDGRVTQWIYTHRSTGRDQAAANLIGRMIRDESGDTPSVGEQSA